MSSTKEYMLRPDEDDAGQPMQGDYQPRVLPLEGKVVRDANNKVGPIPVNDFLADVRYTLHHHLNGATGDSNPQIASLENDLVLSKQSDGNILPAAQGSIISRMRKIIAKADDPQPKPKRRLPRNRAEQPDHDFAHLTRGKF